MDFIQRTTTGVAKLNLDVLKPRLGFYENRGVLNAVSRPQEKHKGFEILESDLDTKTMKSFYSLYFTSANNPNLYRVLKFDENGNFVSEQTSTSKLLSEPGASIPVHTSTSGQGDGKIEQTEINAINEDLTEVAPKDPIQR